MLEALISIYTWILANIYVFGILTMRKANQTIEYHAMVQVPYTDFNNATVNQVEVEMPLAGWLTSVTWEIMFDTFQVSGPTDVAVAAGFLVTADQDFGESFSDTGPDQLKLMNAWLSTGGGVASMQAHNAPFYIWHEAGEDNLWVKKKNLYQLVDVGDVVTMYVFPGNPLAATLTAGQLFVTVTYRFQVGAFSGRSKYVDRRSARGMEVTILARMDTGDEYTHWTPPCNGRIANIRLTTFVYDEDSTVPSYLYFGKSISNASKINQDEIYMQSNGIVLQTTYQDSGTDDPYVAATNYRRSMIFVKKGELMQLRYDTDQEDDIIVEVEFDFIPDFGAQCDWNVIWALNDQGNTVHIRTFQVPFDCFIEEINYDFLFGDAYIEGTGDTDVLKAYIVGLKDTPNSINDSLDVLSGSIMSSSILVDDHYSTLPSSVLETIIMKASNIRGSDLKDGICKVYDYYPEGSIIGIVTDIGGGEGTEDITIAINVTGKSRVKSNRIGINTLDMRDLLRMEVLQ